MLYRLYMFDDEARVLVILPRRLADRARGLAGRTTVAMKRPVSLQIVLRALVEEGLKRTTDPALLANIRRQADTVRRIRRAAAVHRPARPHSRPRA
jgi:hypothetical protein